MIISDIVKKHEDACYAEIQDGLKKNHLDGRVIRIKDGREGELRMENDTLKFYPLIKSGHISSRTDEYVMNWVDITKQYRPKED